MPCSERGVAIVFGVAGVVGVVVADGSQCNSWRYSLHLRVRVLVLGFEESHVHELHADQSLMKQFCPLRRARGQFFQGPLRD